MGLLTVLRRHIPDSEAHAPLDNNQVVPPNVAWISTESRHGTQVKRNRPIEKRSEEAIQTASSSLGIYAANWKTELMSKPLNPTFGITQKSGYDGSDSLEDDGRRQTMQNMASNERLSLDG